MQRRRLKYSVRAAARRPSLPWKRATVGVVLLYLALQMYPLFINSSAGSVVSSWNATMLWGALRAIGQHTSLEGSSVVTDLVNFSVIPECTIFAPLALFTAGVLVFPSTVLEKFQAVVLGILFLSLTNLLRLLTLYGMLGTFPEMFDAVHLFIWQPLMAMTALVLWGIWAARRTRRA